jgi:hypothetical protein
MSSNASKNSRSRAFALFALYVTLPPAVAVGLMYCGHVLTDATKRCYETLDLATPGSVCNLALPVKSILLPVVYLLLIAVPAWLFSRRWPFPRYVLVGTAAFLLIVWATIILSYQVVGSLSAIADLVVFFIPVLLCPVLALLVLHPTHSKRHRVARVA